MRKLRELKQGASYHVIPRAHRREFIFLLYWGILFVLVILNKVLHGFFKFFILFFVFNSFAQDTPELIPFCSGGKWGYCNQEKETIIPVEYFFTGFFREGLVRVKLGGKWGFINISGRKVVPLKYDWAWDFTGGLAWVSLDGNWGYIDHRGTKYWED